MRPKFVQNLSKIKCITTTTTLFSFSMKKAIMQWMFHCVQWNLQTCRRGAHKKWSDVFFLPSLHRLRRNVNHAEKGNGRNVKPFRADTSAIELMNRGGVVVSSYPSNSIIADASWSRKHPQNETCFADNKNQSCFLMRVSFITVLSWLQGDLAHKDTAHWICSEKVNWPAGTLCYC